jgi:hypothetical protein
MNVDTNGFNVINNGTSACSLPEFPLSISLADSDGTLLTPVTLPDASGASSKLDFIDYGLAGASSITPDSPIPSTTTPLTLLPGGVATVILITTNPTYSDTTPTCISTPVGGSISVELSTTESLTVAMPSDVNITPWQDDPTGAAFYSCGAVTVSPFLTWSQAVAVVGAPTADSPTYGLLPQANEALYVDAP